jgi:hypothetical protein
MSAINAAGPDVYDRAISSVRDDRRALLDAVAAAGSAGKAEYQRQAEQSSASKSAALASAVAAAQSRNADPSTIAALQNTADLPKPSVVIRARRRLGQLAKPVQRDR